MSLPWILLAVGVASLWLGVIQWLDFKNSQGEFGEWIVSDASPLDRKLWRANRLVLMICLIVGAVVCFAAFGSLMLK